MITRQIRPTVAINVVCLVPMSAGEQRSAPPATERLRQISHGIRLATARPVHDDLSQAFGRTSSDEVHHAAHRAGTVER